MEKWAYRFNLNHEGAGVGTIYYSKEYFEREGIVNPATAEPYTLEEIEKIKNEATEESENYVNTVPEGALIGMNVLNTEKVFWYDEENSNIILSFAETLILDRETGDMKTLAGEIKVKAM